VICGILWITFKDLCLIDGKEGIFTLENKVYGGLVFHASLISDVFVIIFVYSGGYVMSLLHGFPD